MPLIVLANREPLRQSEGGRWEPSVGGLTTALLPVLEKRGGVWVAWAEEDADTKPRLSYPEDEPKLEVHRLTLSKDEVAGYYYGLANRVLWPVCHYFTERMEIERSFFGVYQAVNQKFADTAARVYTSGDTLWVQDYHLMLAPELLRERLPDARIGFFFHIPWPAEEVWRVLPWARALTEGLLGADVVGFHNDEYVQNFLEAAAGVPEATVIGQTVFYRGRKVRVEAHPIGIDSAYFNMLAQDVDVQAEAASLRHDIGSEFILLGVDRLDYTKGVPERLLAFEQFLASYPEYRKRVTLIQISSPSRTHVNSYQELKRNVDEIAGRINGTYMEGDWAPVRYLYRSHSQRELTSLYLAADVALVTPLRDGMNVVAQEFACVNQNGVLMLSVLAGANAVLPGAISVNPFDTEGVARALKDALTLPQADRTARSTRLRARVIELDVYGWAERFLTSLEDA